MVQQVGKQILAAVVVVLSLAFGRVQAGTHCPHELELDPWLCTTLPSPGGQHFTILSCQGEKCGQNSSMKMPPERGVYDRLVLSDLKNLTLPDRWLEHVRVRELQVIDSMIPSNFFNDTALTGQQDFMVSLSLRNSEIYSPLCTNDCPKPRREEVFDRRYGRYIMQSFHLNHTRFFGLGTLLNLRSLDLSHNRIVNLTSDSFPRTMIRLEDINLSYNQIDVVSSQSLASMPRLAHVNLSHNSLKEIHRQVFAEPNNGLQTLDLSWNSLVALPEDMFTGMRALREVDVSYNLLQSLHFDTWKHLKGNLLWLNAMGNFFICDCDITWIEKLSATAEVHGACASPASLENRHLRGISTMLHCPSSETSNLHPLNPSAVNSTKDHQITPAHVLRHEDFFFRIRKHE